MNSLPGLQETAYDFAFPHQPDETLFVVELEGEERLMAPFRFSLLLASSNPDLEADDLLDRPVRLALRHDRLCDPSALDAWMHGLGGDEIDRALRTEYRGQLTAWEFCGECQDVYLYRATMAHPLERLRQETRCRVFVDQSIPEVAKAVLEASGLASEEDFVFRLAPVTDDSESRDGSGYRRWGQLCQYNETSLDFLHRLLEREGISYFYEDDGKGGRLTFVNNSIHFPPTRRATLRYAPEAEGAMPAVARHLRLRRRQTPRWVVLTDWNDNGKPDLAQRIWQDVEALAPAPAEGANTPSPTASPSAKEMRRHGIRHFHGMEYRGEAEGQRLARIRAEEVFARRLRLEGQATASWLNAGRTVNVSRHFHDDVNGEYLLTAVLHRGRQQAAFLSGLSDTLAGGEERRIYECRFEGIPAGVVYRPELRTPVPQLRGGLSARVDLDGLEQAGQYRIRLPYDLSDRAAGKASGPVRYATPIVGATFGEHFPLWKGTEVLLRHMGGDPSRPVIVGALANPSQPSQSDAIHVAREVIPTGSRFAATDAELDAPKADTTEGYAETRRMLAPVYSTWDAARLSLHYGEEEAAYLGNRLTRNTMTATKGEPTVHVKVDGDVTDSVSGEVVHRSVTGSTAVEETIDAKTISRNFSGTFSTGVEGAYTFKQKGNLTIAHAVTRTETQAYSGRFSWDNKPGGGGLDGNWTSGDWSGSTSSDKKGVSADAPGNDFGAAELYGKNADYTLDVEKDFTRKVAGDYTKETTGISVGVYVGAKGSLNLGDVTKTALAGSVDIFGIGGKLELLAALSNRSYCVGIKWTINLTVATLGLYLISLRVRLLHMKFLGLKVKTKSPLEAKVAALATHWSLLASAKDEAVGMEAEAQQEIGDGGEEEEEDYGGFDTEEEAMDELQRIEEALSSRLDGSNVFEGGVNEVGGKWYTWATLGPASGPVF